MEAQRYIDAAVALFDAAGDVDEACMRATLKLVEERCGPARLKLSTTDESYDRGFRIDWIELADGTEVDEDLVSDLDDDLFEVITSISWSYLLRKRQDDIVVDTTEWLAAHDVKESDTVPD
jgi:hypothetical protein